jgi:hypothetical protein
MMERHPVECLSGHTYADRPIALWWQDERLEISAIIAQWHIPGGRCFRVKTQGDQFFDLTYIEQEDVWTVSPIGERTA